MSKDKNEKWETAQSITLEEFFKLRLTDTAKYAKLLIDQLGEEKAYQILNQHAIEEGKEYGKDLVKNRKPVSSKDDLSDFFHDLYSDPFWDSCLDVEYLEESEDCVKINIKKCIWAHTFKNLDASDLGFHTMCMGDYGIAKGLSSNVSLKRTKTLMQGDDHCDFVWCWKA